MNDFFQELFAGAAKKDSSCLSEYEDEDLNNFFESAVESPKESLLELASTIMENLENPALATDKARKAGLSAKSVEKLAAYLKKNKGELSDLKANQMIGEEDRYHSFDWTIKSVFFSKRDEFKNQKKYAHLNIGLRGGAERLAVTCNKASAEQIRGRLEQLDLEIKQLFNGS